MIDEVLSKELETDALQEIPINSFSNDLEVLKKLRLRYTDELHKREVKIYEELAESLFEVRLGKYLEDGKGGGSFDSFVFEFLEKIKELYVSLLTGNLVSNNERVMCKVTKKVTVDGRTLDRGDIAFLPIRLVVPLWIVEYIIPCKLVDN
ncbi:MAG: hypothetical protein MPF33_06265 [Candidatus Aramenus sp.]|nr:hypothetical protein [Candidatus Aramenus sp.]